MKRQRRQRREIAGLICHEAMATRSICAYYAKAINCAVASGRACSRSTPNTTVRFGRLLSRTKHDGVRIATTSFPIDVARSGKQLLESVKINGIARTTNAAFLKIDAISDGFLPRSAVLTACSLALFSLRGWGR